MAGCVFYEGRSQFDGAPIVGIAVASDSTINRKTGPGIQTYILRSDLSPTDAANVGADRSVCGACPLRPSASKVCYVELGEGAWNIWQAFKRGTYQFDADAEICRGKFVRLGTYGDPAALPFEIWKRIATVASNWSGYTHQWMACDQRFRTLLMASVETVQAAAVAQDMGWRTFRIRQRDENILTNEIVCPSSDEGGNRRQCLNCRACRGSCDGRLPNSIAIVVHGRPWKHSQFRGLNLL